MRNNHLFISERDVAESYANCYWSREKFLILYCRFGRVFVGRVWLRWILCVNCLFCGWIERVFRTVGLRGFRFMFCNRVKRINKFRYLFVYIFIVLIQKLSFCNKLNQHGENFLTKLITKLLHSTIFLNKQNNFMYINYILLNFCWNLNESTERWNVLQNRALKSCIFQLVNRNSPLIVWNTSFAEHTFHH